MYYVSFDQVSKRFKRDFWKNDFQALSNISFSIKRGAVTGFLGANGAGKTTTIRILLDLITPTTGKIQFDASFGASRKEIFSKIGFLPERPYFYPNLTGREFLIYMAKLCGMSGVDIKNGIVYWSERLDVAHALDRKLKTYSKGMLQRIGFASTCIHHPELLILDEPLSGLDPIGRKEFKDIMIDLHKEGKTIFFSSHIVSDVEEICQDVVILEKGKLLYSGEIETLISKHEKNIIEIKADRVLDNYRSNIVLDKKNLVIYKFNNVDKKVILLDFLNSSAQLIGYSLEKPTLEEIVYKIRSYGS